MERDGNREETMNKEIQHVQREEEFDEEMEEKEGSDAESEEALEDDPHSDHEHDAHDMQDDHEDKDDSDWESDNPKKLFVGGLHPNTTEDDIKNYFGAYGTVQACFIARGKGSKGKEIISKGFGFVTMSSPEEAQSVVKTTHKLLGRGIAVTISKPHSEAPERRLIINVAQLDREKTTEESLRAYFSKFGTVTDCVLTKEEADDGTMVSRGFAFVTMALPEEVETILRESVHGRQVIDGANAVVRPAFGENQKGRKRQLYVGNLDPDVTTKKDLRDHFGKFGPIQDVVLRRQAAATRDQAAREGIAPKVGYAFVRISNQKDFESILKAHGGDHGQMIHGRVLEVTRAGMKANDEKLRKFYVGELDKERTTEDDLSQYFGRFGTVLECTLVREQPETEGEEGISKGYAFLLMSTVDETDAILKNPEPHIIHDKEVVVNRASPHTLHRAMINERITKMNVTNLKGSKVTAQDLKDYFGAKSKIVSFQLPVHRFTGKKLGFAVIELDNHHDIEKYTIMHEHYIKDHRCIVTKFKRKSEEQRAKEKRKYREKRRQDNRARAIAGSSRGRSMGDGSPPSGRGFSPRGRGWGRGGWGGGGWNDDGFYEEWPSTYGPMRGSPGRGRGSGHGFGYSNEWGGWGGDGWGWDWWGGDDGWGNGYTDDGWGSGWCGPRGRGSERGRGPRGPRRGRGGQRWQPY